jgi:hypothetical protein
MICWTVLRLTRRDTPLRFEIIPMVHVGEPAFCTAVAQRLPPLRSDRRRRCRRQGHGRRRVACAAPSSGSVAVSALTSSYRLPSRFRRTGLVRPG